MVPLQNAGGYRHIFQAAIGTAANVDLIEWGALHLLYGVNIINALRAGKIGYQLLCPVVQFPDIVGIRIGMDPGDLLQRQVKVIGGFLVSGKKCGFAARLQRHIGNGVPAGHIQRVNGAAHIFQRFIGAAVGAQIFQHLQDNILGVHPGRQLPFHRNADSFRDLHPHLTAAQGGGHFGIAYPGAEAPAPAISGSVAVGSYHHRTGQGIAVFVHQGVRDPLPGMQLADTKAIGKLMPLVVVAGVAGGLVGGAQVVQEDHSLFRVGQAAEFHLIQLLHHKRGVDIMYHAHIRPGHDQIAGCQVRKPGIFHQDLFSHGVAHLSAPPFGRIRRLRPLHSGRGSGVPAPRP